MAYQRPIINTTQGASSDDVPLIPVGVYRVFVEKATVERSKTSGNLMNHVKVQIISPDTVQHKSGKNIPVAGQGGGFYISYSPDDNKRGEPKMKATIEALTKLGVPLPPPADDFDTEVANLTQAVAAYLTGMTFEMVVSSRREPRRDPSGNPLKDSAGNEIVGAEVADFNMFNIVGLPKPISELGITPPPY